MSEISTGKLLREARAKKELSLDDIENLTSIPQHYLLAMELDQPNILPPEKQKQYLNIYSQVVGLNLNEVVSPPSKTEEKQKSKKKKIENSSISAESEENELISPLQSLPQSSLHVSRTRSSRYSVKKNRPSHIPMILLCLAALAILSFVFYVSWKQTQQDEQLKASDYSVVSSKNAIQKSKQTITSSSETTQPSSSSTTSLTTTGGGNNLAVTIENATDNIEVSISFSGSDSSWVSVTNSDSGDAGTLLNATNNNLTTKLLSGTSFSVITLGMTAGISITINGQPLDLSALTSTSVSYITLNIK